MTEKQLNYVRILCSKVGLDAERFSSLTKEEASKVISALDELQRFVKKVQTVASSEEREKFYEKVKEAVEKLSLPEEVKEEVLSLRFSSLFFLDFGDLELLKAILPVPELENLKRFLYLYGIKDGEIHYLGHFKYKELLDLEVLTTYYRFLK